MVVPPGEFETDEGDNRRKVRIEHHFALAAQEVTLAEFSRWRRDRRFSPNYAASGDCPVSTVSWCDAAGYCNWLSKEEAIPEDQWCYEPNEKGEYRGTVGSRVLVWRENPPGEVFSISWLLRGTWMGDYPLADALRMCLDASREWADGRRMVRAEYTLDGRLREVVKVWVWGPATR